VKRPWSNDLGVLWIPSEPEKPARRRLPASRSVDFALASRPAAVMLVAAVLAQSAAVPVSAIAQGKDPVGWLPSEDGGTASGEDNVPDGQLGEEDQPDASTDAAPAPAPAPPPPTPEPVQTPAPTPEPVATPEAVATPAATPEAVATPDATPTPAVAEAPPAPVPAVSEAPPAAEPAVAEAPPAPVPAETEAPPAPVPAVTEAPPASEPAEPAAATPVITPAATATPELRETRETRRAEPKQPIRRTPARPAQPAPPPPPVPSATAPVAAPAAQPARVAIPRGADHYEVRPGDSLWRIAERLLGPRASVRSVAALTAALWEHNRERIGSPSPDVLPAGITILIP
jgi:hypothetical protein